MIKAAMDLGCLDLGCLSSLSDKKKTRVVGVSDSHEFSSSASKSGKRKSPRETSALRKSISKRSSQRKTSPLGWSPRRKGDSYLKRKIKKLQEVGGMNQTLDETLGDSKPHYCKIVREQMAVKEAAGKAMELRKAALVEASWCKILRAARIPSLEAETLMENAEKAAVEAFEAASAMGVIMHDKPNSSRKQYQIETSGTHGKGSPTHTVTASFETAFDVDKEVAAAVKTAFGRLANCPSLSKAEFKDLLKKISENPDLHDNHEITEMSSEYDTESDSELGILDKVEEEAADCKETSYFRMRQLKVKRRQSFGKLSTEKLVDMMLDRLQDLQEDQLSSLASVVATCGLNEALAEVGNHQRRHTTNTEPTASDHGNTSSVDTRSRRESKIGSLVEGKTTSDGTETELPSLDKYLVKHMTKLEREVHEAKVASKDVFDKSRKVPQVVASDPIPDLGSILVKHSSKLEKEIEEAKKKEKITSEAGYGNRRIQKRKQAEKAESDYESLDKILVKHVPRLEKEKLRFKAKLEEEKENSNNNDEGSLNQTLENNNQGPENMKSAKQYESLDKILVKHVPRLEKEKLRFKAELEEEKENSNNNDEGSLNQTQENNNQGPENMKSPKSSLWDRETQETWGGLCLGESKNNNIKRPETKKTEATEPLGEETRPVLTRRQMRDKEMLEAWGGLGLGDSNLYQTVNKNKRKPETEKETATPLLTRRQARDREMQETWGGLDLGNSIRPSMSKLEREKAAWIKAEKEEMSRGN